MKEKHIFKSEQLELIKNYRWIRHKTNTTGGRKVWNNCPCCGSGDYYFMGRFKVCENCNLDNQFEQGVRRIKYLLRSGCSEDWISPGFLSKIYNYIKRRYEIRDQKNLKWGTKTKFA